MCVNGHVVSQLVSSGLQRQRKACSTWPSWDFSRTTASLGTIVSEGCGPTGTYLQSKDRGGQEPQTHERKGEGGTHLLWMRVYFRLSNRRWEKFTLHSPKGCLVC